MKKKFSTQLFFYKQRIKTQLFLYKHKKSLCGVNFQKMNILITSFFFFFSLQSSFSSFCSNTLKYKKVPKVSLPLLEKMSFLHSSFSMNSSILSSFSSSSSSIQSIDSDDSFSNLFTYLLKISTIFYSPSNNKCYQWKCRYLKKEICMYCIPAIFIGGFSKCGTTALCSKLINHPLIKQYQHKEMNIFSKLKSNYTFEEFEKRVQTNFNQSKYLMIDCTSGSYREISSVTKLFLQNSNTKVIFLVRDPWQRMGSWLTMAHRSSRLERYNNVYQNWINLLTTTFIPINKQRYTLKIINNLIQIFPLNGFLYGEILLYWKFAFQNNLLTIDHFNLEHFPLQIIQEIETFLNIFHYNYTEEMLLETSVNTMIKVENPVNSKDFIFIQNDTKEVRLRGRNISPKGIKIRTINQTNIHEPYEFIDDKMLKLVKNLFEPSLCLYEKLFNKDIIIVTKKEFIDLNKTKKLKE